MPWIFLLAKLFSSVLRSSHLETSLGFFCNLPAGGQQSRFQWLWTPELPSSGAHSASGQRLEHRASFCRYFSSLKSMLSLPHMTTGFRVVTARLFLVGCTHTCLRKLHPSNTWLLTEDRGQLRVQHFRQVPLSGFKGTKRWLPVWWLWGGGLFLILHIFWA